MKHRIKLEYVPSIASPWVATLQRKRIWWSTDARYVAIGDTQEEAEQRLKDKMREDQRKRHEARKDEVRSPIYKALS